MGVDPKVCIKFVYATEGNLDIFQILRFNVMSTSYLLAIFVLAILLFLKICARIEKVPVHPGAGSAPKAPFTQVRIYIQGVGLRRSNFH